MPVVKFYLFLRAWRFKKLICSRINFNNSIFMLCIKTHRDVNTFPLKRKLQRLYGACD